ncbi:MAG TPA: BON domain-containing protein [Thermoanaerobaculia bacterium]
MDDSERSYGYSQDIYHGGRGQRSYEYGPESPRRDADLSPEEAAVHIQGGGERDSRPTSGRAGGRYDYGRTSTYGGVESFTWDIEGPHRGRGPRGYKRTDERIHEDVCDRLAAHGDVDASDIEVKVENGEVTLTGNVPDRRTKRLAESVAESVRGVVDVHNQLRLGGRQETR